MYKEMIAETVPDRWFPEAWTVQDLPNGGVSIKTPELGDGRRVYVQSQEIRVLGWDPDRVYMPQTWTVTDGVTVLEKPKDIVPRAIQAALEREASAGFARCSQRTFPGVIFRVMQMAQREVNRLVRERGLLKSKGLVIPKTNIIRVDSQLPPENLPGVHPAWAQYQAHIKDLETLAEHETDKGHGVILNVSASRGTALFQVTKGHLMPRAVQAVVGSQHVTPDRVNGYYGLNAALNTAQARVPVVEELSPNPWDRLVVCKADGTIPVTAYANSSIYGEDMILVRHSTAKELRIRVKRRYSLINTTPDKVIVNVGDVVDPTSEYVLWDLPRDEERGEGNIPDEVAETLAGDGFVQADPEALEELEFQQQLLEISKLYAPGVWEDDPEPDQDDEKAHRKWERRQARKERDRQEVLPPTPIVVRVKGSLLGVDGLGKEHHARIPFPGTVTEISTSETVLHGERVPVTTVVLDVALPLATGQKVVARSTAKGTVLVIEDEEMDQAYGPTVEVVWQGEKPNRHSQVVADLVAGELAHQGVNGWTKFASMEDVLEEARLDGIPVKHELPSGETCFIGRLPFVASADHNPWASSGIGNRFPTRQITRGTMKPEVLKKTLFGNRHCTSLLKEMIRMAL